LLKAAEREFANFASTVTTSGEKLLRYLACTRRTFRGSHAHSMPNTTTCAVQMLVADNHAYFVSEAQPLFTFLSGPHAL
jgi:hypothetical protein